MHGSPSTPAAGLVRLTVAAVALSTLGTALVWTLPFARFAYRGPALHTALETAASLVALLVAYLVLLRFRRLGRLSDLMLFAALAMLASTTALFSALPSALAQAPGHSRPGRPSPGAW